MSREKDRPYIKCKYNQDCNACLNGVCYALYEYAEDEKGACKFYKHTEGGKINFIRHLLTLKEKNNLKGD